MFFLQMSGFPGSGKSTLARAISKECNAIIVDHDIIKSALLESMAEHQLDPSASGKIGYSIDWSLVDFYLSQGFPVILDSPCLYREMVDKGLALSKKYKVNYKYVECIALDIDIVNKRLQERSKMASQISAISSEEVFYKTIENSAKPEEMMILQVNTLQSLEEYIGAVMNYVKG
ncbi:MAG: AAA family ATPase [Lysinibacillus sp.]